MSTNPTAMPNDSPDIPGNKLATTDSTNRRSSCKLHRYSAFPTNKTNLWKAGGHYPMRKKN